MDKNIKLVCKILLLVENAGETSKGGLHVTVRCDQVTCEYRMEKGACVPLRVHTVVISIQHSETISIEQLRTDLMEHVIKAVIPRQYLDEKTVYHLQPSGKFVIGGPQVCCFRWSN